MKLKDKFTELMHNQALKRKLYVIIFEADTPVSYTHLQRMDSALCGTI